MLEGLDDPAGHLDRYLVDLMETFPALAPWNIGRLTIREYLALTARIDARREAARRERNA